MKRFLFGLTLLCASANSFADITRGVASCSTRVKNITLYTDGCGITDSEGNTKRYTWKEWVMYRFDYVDQTSITIDRLDAGIDQGHVWVIVHYIKTDNKVQY